MKPEYTFQFPAIKGVQAGREYYSFMCPIEHLSNMFDKSDVELPPELSSQRMLNKGRIPSIVRYIIDNPDNYVLSSLTASVDRETKFEAINRDHKNIGTLTISMSANFVINDGQHRLAALKQAYKEAPNLKYENISIVLFIDRGLEKSQQMFADLNRYAAKPTKSLSLLYDHRDPMARVSYELTKEVSYFKGMVEMAKTSISNRSTKLFTLSSIYQANCKILNKKEGDDVSSKEKALLFEFWEEIGNAIPDWHFAYKKEASSYELRQEKVHAHGIAIQALAKVAVSILNSGKALKGAFSTLHEMDWRRSNSTLWEGRAVVGGVINRSQANVTLTANLLKAHLGLELDPSEEKLEEKYRQGNH